MQSIEVQPDLGYVTGLTGNAVWQPLAQEVIEQAKRASAAGMPARGGRGLDTPLRPRAMRNLR